MKYFLLAIAILFLLFMGICLLSAMNRIHYLREEEKRRGKNKITGGGLEGW